MNRSEVRYRGGGEDAECWSHRTCINVMGFSRRYGSTNQTTLTCYELNIIKSTQSPYVISIHCLEWKTLLTTSGRRKHSSRCIPTGGTGKPAEDAERDKNTCTSHTGIEYSSAYPQGMRMDPEGFGIINTPGMFQETLEILPN